MFQTAAEGLPSQYRHPLSSHSLAGSPRTPLLVPSHTCYRRLGHRMQPWDSSPSASVPQRSSASGACFQAWTWRLPQDAGPAKMAQGLWNGMIQAWLRGWCGMLHERNASGLLASSGLGRTLAFLVLGLAGTTTEPTTFTCRTKLSAG